MPGYGFETEVHRELREQARRLVGRAVHGGDGQDLGHVGALLRGGELGEVLAHHRYDVRFWACPTRG